MLILTQASEQDFSAIEQLACLIWEKHYIPIIGDEQVRYMLHKMYRFDAIKKQAEEGQVFYLIHWNRELVGFVSLSSGNQRDFMLHKFYLLQDKQGKGMGTRIFKKICDELYQPETIRLTVNRQNYKSINFYFKLGFVIEKTADFDIGAGYFMNDFVMLWQNKNYL